ncbi:MAG: CPBP family intramembrane metalloprotease [Planctomycetales bacterium]|nr:CPBP family intramembrane metalloprotease [Planctomycetales bacterium]
MNEESQPSEEMPDDFLFAWACGFELAIGAIGLLIAWFVGIDARAYLGRLEDLTWQSLGRDLGIGVLASLPMLAAVALLMKIPHDSIVAINRLADVPTMKALLSLPHGELLVLSLCAGIGEELAFRGCMLPWLTAVRDATGQLQNNFNVGDSFATAVPSLLVVAVMVSSIGFGMLHPITKLYVVIASLMGVYFAALLIMTDSLLVPIVAHAAYDAAQFFIAKREIDAEPQDDPAESLE